MAESDPTAGLLLRVDGHVPHPRTFSLAQLQALPQVDLGPTEVVCLSARQVRRAHHYAGVRITDLLGETGFGTLPRNTLKQCVVVCHGADGYRAIFSWNELFNTAVGDRALAIVQRDGRPLADDPGELSLISAADLLGGPRNLQALVMVEACLLP
ncbi:MAG: molybdopterin-dependent oxidoreductase [Pseudomonadota bacterium]